MKYLKFTGALIILATAGAAAQETYPNRPIMVISPWAAGGVGEISARIIGEHMAKALGQPLVIDSRGGGGSKIGTEIVVKAPKDGYTLLFQNVVHSILPTVAAPLNYDPVRDFSAVVHSTSYPLMLVAHPSVSANNPAELIAFMKKNPGKLTYGSGGLGTAMHFAGEMLKTMAGVDMLHVPYKGMSAATNDTIAGHVQLTFGSFTKETLDSGKLKALATTGRSRDPRFPDVPALSELLPGYRIVAWQGFLAPAGVPKAIITKLNAAGNSALADAGIRAKFNEMGLTAVGGTPEEFASVIQDDIALFRQIATEAKLTFN